MAMGNPLDMKFLLVGATPTPLKNMKFNWDDYSQYVENKNVPNHQPVIRRSTVDGWLFRKTMFSLPGQVSLFNIAMVKMDGTSSCTIYRRKKPAWWWWFSMAVNLSADTSVWSTYILKKISIYGPQSHKWDANWSLCCPMELKHGFLLPFLLCQPAVQPSNIGNVLLGNFQWKHKRISPQFTLELVVISNWCR